MSFTQFLYETNKSLFIKFNWKIKLSNNDKDQLYIASQNYKLINK